MASRKIVLMAAPLGMQPTAYITKAYGDANEAVTKSAELFVKRSRGWQVRLRWRAPRPIEALDGDPGRFVDACALFTGETPETPWITMGAPGHAVSGLLWRADRDRPYGIRAEGIGSMRRSEADITWNVMPMWANGLWDVTFEMPLWPALDRSKRLAIAVWQGAERQRAGLKSVSPDWVTVG